MNQIIQTLVQHQAFQHVPQEDVLRMVEKCTIRVYQVGELICKQGEEANCALLLIQGTLDVLVSNHQEQFFVGTIFPGEVFGEHGLFLHSVRNAHVFAKTKSICMQIFPHVLKEEVHNPATVALERHLLVSMARRLKNSAHKRVHPILPSKGMYLGFLHFCAKIVDYVRNLG